MPGLRHVLRVQPRSVSPGLAQAQCSVRGSYPAHVLLASCPGPAPGQLVLPGTLNAMFAETLCPSPEPPSASPRDQAREHTGLTHTLRGAQSTLHQAMGHGHLCAMSQRLWLCWPSSAALSENGLQKFKLPHFFQRTHGTSPPRYFIDHIRSEYLAFEGSGFSQPQSLCPALAALLCPRSTPRTRSIS